MATRSRVENIWRQEVQWRTYGDKKYNCFSNVIHGHRKYSGEHMATRGTVENIQWHGGSKVENIWQRVETLYLARVSGGKYKILWQRWGGGGGGGDTWRGDG